MADFSVRFRQLTQRLLDQTQIKEIFNEPEVSESQGIARQLAEAGDRITQLSQVVAEAEVLSQLHNSLVNECESLRMEKSNLESFVLDLHQERNEIEPQVMYFRDELTQAQGRLEEVQTRERSLSDRERQLTDIVAQLERRRAVLNQTIENLTNQEADFIVRTQELSQAIETREEQATQMMQTVSHFTVSLDELVGQVEEKRAELKAMGVDPDELLREKLQEAKELLREVESTQAPTPHPEYSNSTYPPEDTYNRGYNEPSYGTPGYGDTGYDPYNNQAPYNNRVPYNTPEPYGAPAPYNEQAPYDNGVYDPAAYAYPNNGGSQGYNDGYNNPPPPPPYGEGNAGGYPPSAYEEPGYGTWNAENTSGTQTYENQNYENQNYENQPNFNQTYSNRGYDNPAYADGGYSESQIPARDMPVQASFSNLGQMDDGNPSEDSPFPPLSEDDPWTDRPAENSEISPDGDDRKGPEAFTPSPFNDNPWG
ncbi:MAG: hypothetical protein AB4040_06595 [Synechococcus sp.]